MMQTNLKRLMAVAATAALAIPVAPTLAHDEGAWTDLDLIETPPGACSLVAYADADGNRLSAPPPGVEPVQFTRMPAGRIETFVRPDGSIEGALFPRPAGESAARGTAMVVGSQATYMVNYNDAAAEGFFDTTVVAPVGGNTGTTRGEQRRLAFQNALLTLANEIQSSVTIVVDVQFDPLFCTSGSALLGQAGPNAINVNNPGLIPNTVYPGALANAVVGMGDLNGNSDITAAFNSNLDTGCFSGGAWYYGLDNTPGGNIDFSGTVLHEVCHGLGFTTFVDLSTGAKVDVGLGPQDDPYMRFLRDNSTAQLWPAMSNGQRQASAIDNGDLVWDGAEVTTRNGFLTGGSKTGGRTRMFAPSSLQLGSSVAHWDTALNPNELMEPIDTGSQTRHQTRALFGDLGYMGLVPVEISMFELE